MTKLIKYHIIHELEVPDDFDAHEFAELHRPASMWDSELGVAWIDCRVFVEETTLQEIEVE